MELGIEHLLLSEPHIIWLQKLFVERDIIVQLIYDLQVNVLSEIYFCVGICLYEFMCGMVPFGEEAEDPYEIYEEIIKTELTYPNYLKDKKAKKLMDQLLNKVPEIRLGGSYAALKANAWFENFDWVIR